MTSNIPLMLSSTVAAYGGPPVSPPSRVKPAPEMSKDFLRNMRDLQNSMEDFSRLHDTANACITPFTNFSDETVSSALFVALFAASCLMFFMSHLVPWRFAALIAGWTLTLCGHPTVRSALLRSSAVTSAKTHARTLGSDLRAWAASDIDLSSAPETRQVEVFELQKHHRTSDTWEPWLYTPSPYDPLSPARIAGARPKGTQFFEDVQSPAGWRWRDTKWTLDLASREWVEERMITAVEVEMEGARWVYDLPGTPAESTLDSSPHKARKGAKAPTSGWEETLVPGERGEWRRRRWVRHVVQKGVEG